MQSITPPPAQRGHGDVEGGEAVHRQSRTNGTKDGGMVILVGAGAAFATAAVTAAVTSEANGGSCGGCDSEAGACGGCGGGCGGCGAD